MKKTLSPIVTGLLIGIAAGFILETLFSEYREAPVSEESKPQIPIKELLSSLNRKRIIAVSQERFEDAAKLRDAINKIKFNGDAA